MMKQKQETMQPKMTNGSSDLFSIPDDELAELVWENGQIVVQNQSSRPRKSSFPGPFSSRHGGVQEKDTRECANSKFAQFSEGDPLIDDFATPRHSTQNGENGHDDDMVPWISYPIEEVLASEALQNDYCAEFLNEFSAFDLNPLSANKNAIATGRSAGLGLEVRNSTNVEHGHACKAPVGSSEPGRIRSSQLFQQSEQCQSSVPKSTVIDIGGGTGAGGGHVTQERHCGDMVDGRLQRDQGMASCKQQSGTASLMNFSHFARPAALAKVSLQNAGGLRSIEKVSTLSRSNPIALIPIESGGANGVKDVSRESGPRKLDLGSAMKTPQEGGSVEQSSNAICLGDALRKNNKPENCSRLPDTFPSSSFAASVALCKHKVRKDLEAAVASSSVCSGNITGSASNAPKHSQKRKEYEGDDSDYHSEDLQEESVGIRKPPSGARTARTKRSRAAEVHNLSEKRRRNRINEKMRALQELIPNCNKVDKASMLEEAIEYLKTLQLQVQIMSMGRLYMPPMMLPPAMQQHIRAPAMAHFPPLGVGMSMGIGLAPGCPMIPIPPMHPPQFPCAPAPGFNGMPGPVSPPLFGLQGQGFPVPMPRPPPFSTLPGVPGTMTAPPARANAAAIAAGDQQQQQN